MPEQRTPEQIAADEALHAAIEQAAHAYWQDEYPMVTEFVVLAVRESPETPGEREYNYMLPGGTLPWHRILGLLHTFRVLMESSLAGNRDTD